MAWPPPFPIYINPNQSCAKLLGTRLICGEPVFVTLTRCLDCGCVILKDESLPVGRLRFCCACPGDAARPKS